MSATAGNDELVNFRFGQNETVQRIDDREGGENCRCTDEIVRLGAKESAECEEFFQVSMAVIFAPGGFGRCELQVRITQKIVKECGEVSPPRCEVSVFIVSLAATREMRDKGVNDHVRWAGIEREDLLRLAGARKNRDVGDAAEIERDATELRVAVKKIVHIGDERRALATQNDVRGTKIADRRDARARGDDGSLADLQRRGSGPA